MYLAVKEEKLHILQSSIALFQHSLNSKIKQLLHLCGSVIGVANAVTDGTRIGVDLVVVTTLVGLVAEEVDGGVIDTAGQVLLLSKVLEAVCLVPTLREDVERDLTTNGVPIDQYSQRMHLPASNFQPT